MDPVAERFDCEEANRMMRREPRAPWYILTSSPLGKDIPVRTTTLCLGAFDRARRRLPLSAKRLRELPQLIADAARFESGQSTEAIWKIEELLRDSAHNRPCVPGGRAW